MKSKREERGKSDDWAGSTFLIQIDPNKSKFLRKDSLPTKQTFYLDNKIRRINASDLIKKSDVSLLQKKLLMQEQKADENTDTENYLYQLKKGYDELVKASTRKQKQATHMKECIDTIKIQLKGSTETMDGKRKYLEDMERRLEELKLKQETTTMTAKSLEHMLDRMKKDEVVHQIRVNQLEGKARALEAYITQSREKNMGMCEFGALSNIAVKTVEDSYLDAKEQRKRDMTHFQTIMIKRTLADERTEERQRITEDIQAMAASDLNDSEILKWKKLLMVQKFLKKLLKQKISNIEEKYSDVKNAFYTIKLKTNVTDPAGLMSSFFNLEETYQKLLDNVRILQVKFRNQQAEKKEIEKKADQIKSQILMLTANRDTKSPHNLSKEVEDVMEKSCQSELCEDRIYFWLINTLYKLDSVSDKFLGTRQKYYQQYPKQKLAQNLNDLLQRLTTKVSKQTAQPQHHTPYTQLKHLQATTNKPLLTQQTQQQSEKDQQVKKQYRRATKLY